MSRARHLDDPRPSRHRGAALLILLLVMVLAFSSVLIGSLAKNDPEIERQRKTFEALAQAKQALIAWSMVRGDVSSATYRRPGALSCPEAFELFGEDAKSGDARGNCTTEKETSIGRLPWKTLDMENLSDTHGEPLWYAVSKNFSNNVQDNDDAINSDTEGTLRLYASDGVTLMTPVGEELAAVILAPGPPLPGQDRKAPSDNRLVPSSYLEAFNGKNNTSAAGPFIMGPVRDSAGNWVVNDLVIGVTARELISGAERRALNEAQSALEKYKYANNHDGRYPNPAPFDGANCTSSITDVQLDIAPCASGGAMPACYGYGRLPENALSPYVAPWFLKNGWGRVMIYAVNNANDDDCASTLKVDGNPKKYVLLAPGTARAGQRRPSTMLSDYLEDAANADAWSGDPNFSTPSANSNDQLRAVP